MTPQAALDIFGLAIASVYCTIPLFWLVIHPFVDRWRARGRRSFALLLPVWAVFIAAAFALGWRLRHLHLYQSWAAWIPGVLFIILGFSIYRAAFQGFDKALASGLAELEPSRHDQNLIVNGIRERVRHPIYLGHFCEVFGWSLGTGSAALLILLAFAVVTGAVMIRLEDDELEERFGEPYRVYRQQVSAFLPKSR
jgi:protein-S-isoprenylcysteine O-methyltransferase Ste14